MAPRRDWLALANALPAEPGVYLFKVGDEIVYVGKAKSLAARVRSYFSEGSSDYRPFIGGLAGELDDIETLVTRSEKEALILERELIKKHEPRYNVIWRDDKQYLCLRVDPTHEYPWVQVVRQMGKDGARYFGPFHSASAARQTLRVVNRHFQLRTCRDSVLYARTRPCLEYQIGRCPAPCVLEVDRAEYGRNVDDALMFLEGRGGALVERLETRMWAASEGLQFEVAARLRDQIAAIERTLERQHAALPSMRDQDVLGLFRQDGALAFAVVEVRAGRIRDVRAQLVEDPAFDDAELVSSFLLQFYAAAAEIPREVLIPVEIEGAEVLAELLGERRGGKVEIKQPRRGERARVLELARDNAEHAYFERRRKAGAMRSTLEGLKRKLGLTRLPDRMECYDISNLQGTEVVGSRVAFRAGLPDKRGYRRYRIKATTGQDDFAAMYEVLSRRFARGPDADPPPDLIVIDGGKGQLGSALAALTDRAVSGVDLVSLAKSRRLDSDDEEVRRSPERVFVPGAKDPIVLKQSSPEVHLLAALRDEAHRFAIEYNRKLRKKRHLGSELDGIRGVGPVRRRALLTALGSVRRIREASEAEIAAVVGASAARAIRAHFGADEASEQESGRVEKD